MFFRARQREFKFHLSRKLMTKDPGQDSIIGVNGYKIKCFDLFLRDQLEW